MEAQIKVNSYIRYIHWLADIFYCLPSSFLNVSSPSSLSGLPKHYLVAPTRVSGEGQKDYRVIKQRRFVKQKNCIVGQRYSWSICTALTCGEDREWRSFRDEREFTAAVNCWEESIRNIIRVKIRWVLEERERRHQLDIVEWFLEGTCAPLTSPWIWEKSVVVERKGTASWASLYGWRDEKTSNWIS